MWIGSGLQPDMSSVTKLRGPTLVPIASSRALPPLLSAPHPLLAAPPERARIAVTGELGRRTGTMAS